ncbi:helix-turn-helix domain-containing protein [Streptomyces sp. NPDC000987]|uniref:TetR/AcrR family transcriptional regulator n=1 Tax=Streptomyces sp. NPDC000987 TaxID=3154374 RepID=UPI00332C749A
MSKDERVEAVLDAAYTCFTRHGVRRTTMDDIARAAGMSRPAVYQHVRNKEDAFHRLVERMLDDALEATRQALAQGGEPAPRILGALRPKLEMVMRVWHDSPAHAAELLAVDARLSGELLAHYDETMRGLLRDALRHSGLGPDSAETAELLLALTRGLEADPTDPQTAFGLLGRGVELMIAGLTAGRETTP